MKVTDLSNRSDRNVEPIPDINTDINTDVNTDRESTPETTAIELAGKPEKVELNNVVDEFNQVVSRLPKVTALTTKRRNTIQQRIKEHGREAVSVCFDKAGKSDFLCGINDRGWMASFDWIMKPENFVKIIEGNYDNKIQVPQNVPCQSYEYDCSFNPEDSL
jgi:hypothetical protein